MSSVYVLEPPTKGKVVMNTTMGPIDIEFWPKEAPKAVRNFVQLAMEGYYDNTTFHRIIKSFLVQGGDPTGTGMGGESIYGGTFEDEFHSRLRFNHRGLVACANAGSSHTNGSQFFLSLDRCDWLDRKNAIFGKLNLLSFGEEAQEEEKELAAVKEKIKSSHDVLDDPRLLKGEPTDQQQRAEDKSDASEKLSKMDGPSGWTKDKNTR
ncbi:unnamed protein product [Victoria cruziana]